MSIRSLITEVFKHGIVSSIEERSIPRGAASSSLNWLTMGDKIELRRGMEFLGDVSQNAGSGKATGLKKATDALGVEVLFYTYGQKLKYFDRDTSEWVEVGSDLLGADADGEEISLEEYVTNAGNQVWVNSPKCAGYFKIMTANPGSAVDQYSSSKNYKGHIKIDTNSTFLWRRPTDKTGLYRSYIDSQTYTTVSAEALTDVSTGTLAFKGSGAKRTCFGVQITVTGSGQVFTDDYAGTLTGDQGGTGTINYATGAYTTDDTGAGTVDYQWEDSTNGGIADFTGSTAGTGATYRQDEGGGPLQSVASYNNVYYCLHERKTWALTLAIDDTPSGTSNVPYRERVGIPSTRARVESGDGIYYIDTVSGQDPAVRLLTYDRSGSAQVIPLNVSKNIDLNDFAFDQACGYEFGDFTLFGCRTTNSTVNNRTLCYNRVWKSWDLLDYAVNAFDVYDGALHGADALTDNVAVLFSGYADDDAVITNSWEGKLDDLDIEGLKKTKQLRLRGEIAIDQALEVSLSFDNGPYVEIGGTDNDDGTHTYAIEGQGTYVDRTQRVTVGPLTLGRGEVGGGSDGFDAYIYERIFKIGADKFDSVKIRFRAKKVGYVSVSRYEYWDIRFKGKKAPRKYRG